MFEKYDWMKRLTSIRKCKYQSNTKISWDHNIYIVIVTRLFKHHTSDIFFFLTWYLGDPMETHIVWSIKSWARVYIYLSSIVGFSK